MPYNLKSVKDVNVANKIVLLRTDLDVPLQSSIISHQPSVADDARLKAGLETINYLLQNNAKVIICGHLGRPKDQFSILNFPASPELQRGEKFSKENDEFSLKPVVQWYQKQLGIKNQELRIKIGEFDGWKISENISLLENLRFYKEEEENDTAFSQKLAAVGEIYVNDAFAVAHRAHASTFGVTKFLPHFAGMSFLKEVENLTKVLQNPEHPLIVIIGGMKIETKLPLVNKMHKMADYVLVGGKIASEKEALQAVEDQNNDGQYARLVKGKLNIDSSEMTVESVDEFVEIIKTAKTVLWNGPLGIVEKGQRSATLAIANAIIASRAFSVVGGGDTVGFLNQEKLLDKFSFVSMAGGAMLEFLSGEKLPGIEALKI